VAKLKNLVSCLSIRRPKHTIQLPPRQDRIVKLEPNNKERQLYKYIRTSTLQSIGRVDREDGNANLFNVLKMLNQLRLVCNHGLQGKKYAYSVTRASINNPAWTEKAAQSRFDHLDAVGLAKFSNPECDQNLSSASSSESDNEHEDEPYIEKALTVLCFTCVSDQAGAASRYLKVCNHFPRQFFGDCNSDINDIFDAENPFSIVQSRAVVDRADCVPTKIRRIVHDLLQTTDDTKMLGLSAYSPRIILIFAQRCLYCVDKDSRYSSAATLFQVCPMCKIGRNIIRYQSSECPAGIAQQFRHQSSSGNHIVRWGWSRLDGSVASLHRRASMEPNERIPGPRSYSQTRSV